MMASDTVPAAVPGPGDQAGATPNGSTQPAQPGGFASLFAAVDPARAADASFDLNPITSGLDGASDSHTGGGSSAAFHGEDTKDTGTGNGSGNSGSTRQERSVLRAWLLAGAERWKKGGDARLERLRISKAKANAFQVKESRTVAVNRAGGGLFSGGSNRSGGGSGASGGGNSGSGKSLGSKSGGGKGPKGPSNKSGASGNGSGGRSGSGGGAGTGGGGGRGPSGGSGGQSGTGPRGPKNSPRNGNGSGKGSGGDAGGTTKTDKTKDPKAPSPKHSPDSKSSTGKDGKNGPAGSGKAGPQGPAGTTGKNTPAPGGGKDSDPKGDRKKTSGPDKVSLDKLSKTKKGDDPKTSDPKNAPKDADRAADPRQKPGTGPAPGVGEGKTLNTRDSRETGYRDGTRAAKTVAHVKAYRDGVQDGYRDTTEAAEREKARLDQAHADRKKQRDEDKPVTGASSADYHPKTDPQAPAVPQQDSTQPQATPVQVKHIDATHLQLGDGAARTHISRGEVRTLRNFQNRLTAKTDVMTRVAEATKALKVHADEQAKQVTTLLEQAKAVEGGNSLVAALTKLEDNAKTQAGKAEEIHKRALRAAEAAKAVVVNSETRYGDIYKAVADSPETRPAKMTYYQETANA